MAATPVTVDGMLYDLLNKTTQRVVLIGELSLTGLVPSHPIMLPGMPGWPTEPPKPPGGSGGTPTHPIMLPGMPGWGLPGGPSSPPENPTEPQPPPPGGGWAWVPGWGWGYFPDAPPATK